MVSPSCRAFARLACRRPIPAPCKARRTSSPVDCFCARWIQFLRVHLRRREPDRDRGLAHGRRHQPGHRRPHHHRCARGRRGNGSHFHSEQARHLFQYRSQVSPALHVSRLITLNNKRSVCSTDVATSAVRNGARCITHLFNAMPQLHHRDPSIIGLLGASPYTSSGPASDFAPLPSSPAKLGPSSGTSQKTPYASEAFDEIQTPPETPAKRQINQSSTLGEFAFERPFYEIIVDGIHSHPNSVRVRTMQLSDIFKYSCGPFFFKLAYSAHPDGCILITDGKHVCRFVSRE